MKKQKIIAAVLLLATAVLAVVSYILLPETVITQVGGSGNTTMPKLFAVALPTVFGAGGALAMLLAKGENPANKKALIISIAGVAVFVIMLLVNLL